MKKLPNKKKKLPATITAIQPLQPQASYKGATVGRFGVPFPYSSFDPRTRYGTDFDRRAMMNRARELQRNNAIFAGVLLRMTENVVGDGHKLQITSADPDWNSKAETLMENWFPYADSSGLTWLEHQQRLYRSSRRDGDVAEILLDNGQLQIAQGDQIGSPYNFQNDRAWIDGIHYSGDKPDAFAFQTLGNDFRIKPTVVSSQDVILFAKRDDGIRGMSAFAPTFELFDQLDQWVEALIVAARVAACYSLIIQKTGATDAIVAMQAVAAAQAAATASTCNVGGMVPAIPAPQIKLGPGMVNYVENGDSVTQLNPSQPTQSFPDSLRMLLRILGAPVGLPLELIIQDFKDVSGPTARVALQLAFRTARTEQRLFQDTVLSRIYRWRISKFIKAGLIEYRPDVFNHRWIGPQLPVLDPLREYQAQKLGIDMGIETQSSLIQQTGHDFESWLQVRKYELDEQRKANIPLTHTSAVQPYVKITDSNSSAEPLQEVEDDGTAGDDVNPVDDGTDGGSNDE